MKLKHIVIILLLFILLFIYNIVKYPTEDITQQKIDELSRKINEIESLIKSAGYNFDLIKNSIIQYQSNSQNSTDLIRILEYIQKKTHDNEDIEISRKYPKFCPGIQYKRSDISISKLIENLDFTDVNGGVWKQGFEISYNLQKYPHLNIIVVPHSHQDPGWIKTFDEYFIKETKPSLDSMLEFLSKHSDMHFIYAEMSYFSKWFETLNETQKSTLKKILDNKQLEIVTGGWVMNDEANTHYFSIINQLTEGHLFLRQNFNYYPKSAWTIDDFGHSQTMPYLFRKSGIDNVVFNRAHYILKKYLSNKRQLEFQWSQTWDINHNFSLLSHMMPFFSYDVPHTCGPDPSICCQFDFLRLIKYPCPWKKSVQIIHENNIRERSELLLDQYRKKAELFDNGHNLLIPLGDDFRYQTHKEWDLQYENYNKIMKYLNTNAKYNVSIRFGTLFDYFNLIKDKANKLPTLNGDLFTYSDRNQDYWSGYFTSRPYLKKLERILMHSLRDAEITLSIMIIHNKKNHISPKNDFYDEIYSNIDVARKSLSLAQHHDTITGTSKSYVTRDAENRIQIGINAANDVFLKSSQNIIKIKNIETLTEDIFKIPEQTSKLKGSKYFIRMKKTSEKIIFLFNSLAKLRQSYIHIIVETNSKESIKVVNAGNLYIKCQLRPYNILDDSINDNIHILSFKINMEPLSYHQIKIIKTELFDEDSCSLTVINHFNYKNKYKNENYITHSKNNIKKDIIINKKNCIFHLNSENGNLKYIENKILKMKGELFMYFKEYESKRSDKSGAYIFSPNGNGKIKHLLKNEFYHIVGNLFDEVIIITKEITTMFTFYDDDGIISNAFDIENLVNIKDYSDLELSMVLATNLIDSKSIFYTDSNCFQFMMRKNLTKLPIQGNVYPSTCGAFIQSFNNGNYQRFSIFSKQSNGVTGGTIKLVQNTYSFLEIFQDRIFSYDDNRGMEEAMRDNVEVLKSYRINIENWMGYDSDLLSVTENELLNDFIFPVKNIILEISTNSQWIVQKNLLTGIGLPCDYQLVNLRTNKNENPKLLIRRSSLNCQSKYNTKWICSHSKKLSPLFKSLFDDLIIKYVKKSLITGINATSDTFIPESVKIIPMELESFELFFDFN